MYLNAEALAFIFFFIPMVVFGYYLNTQADKAREDQEDD